MRTPKRRLVPAETVDPAECVAPASAKRVQCASCCKVMNGGAVVTDDAFLAMLGEEGIQEVSDQLRRADELAHRACADYAMRLVYCDGCNHLQIWAEMVDSAGEPTGDVLTAPALIRGRCVEAYLDIHPEGAGVLQR